MHGASRMHKHKNNNDAIKRRVNDDDDNKTPAGCVAVKT